MDFDVIVVGAGHAGMEAAMAASRLGARTLCLCLGLDNVGLMPCNPSIGGPAKGHIVREIDALGGVMGLATDACLIQLKVLNTSKGPAVRALRAQVDKARYHRHMLGTMLAARNLTLRQHAVEGLVVEGVAVCGVRLRGGAVIRAHAVVLTTGTYLSGRVFVGESQRSEGPNGQEAPGGISADLAQMGLSLMRLKTGTPPRVDSRTVDRDAMLEQIGDTDVSGFSWLSRPLASRGASCWLTYTNEATHDIVRHNLGRAPMYSGAISGKGPRYCPSFEGKVVTFPDRDRHQVFVEPEGLEVSDMYLGGLSTSMPADVQEDMVHSIQGLERAKIVKYGYAIEYDAVRPYQLGSHLGLKGWQGLYSAGQINGTSGYEEAAAQGLLAGVNAARFSQGLEPVTLTRRQAYIGVLVDDLATRDIDEPYRMMTTLAEHRMLLRNDNADERLTLIGREWGLVGDEQMRAYEEGASALAAELERAGSTRVANPTGVAGENVRLADLLRRPDQSYESTAALDPGRPTLRHDTAERAEIRLKYEGYIARQEAQVARLGRSEAKALGRVDYAGIAGLSSEAIEKLAKMMPETLGQASRIGGVSAADLASLMVYLAKGEREGRSGR